VRAGLPIRLAGYGASGHGSAAPTIGADALIKRVGTNVIEEVFPQAVPGAPDPGPPRVYSFTFRQAPAGGSRLRSMPGSEMPTGLAGGDSGSPALVGARDALRLLGLNIFTARLPQSPGALSTYGTLCGGVLVAPHWNWIAGAMRAG